MAEAGGAWGGDFVGLGGAKGFRGGSAALLWSQTQQRFLGEVKMQQARREALRHR